MQDAVAIEEMVHPFQRRHLCAHLIGRRAAIGLRERTEFSTPARRRRRRDARMHRLHFGQRQVGQVAAPRLGQATSVPVT
jgi:hypothetical protein